MADRPELLARVYEETLRVRGGKCETPLTLEIVDDMTFTRAVVKETLRYRPPVIMFPYIAKKNYPVTETYTIPKGTSSNIVDTHTSFSAISLTCKRLDGLSIHLSRSARSRSISQPGCIQSRSVDHWECRETNLELACFRCRFPQLYCPRLCSSQPYYIDRKCQSAIKVEASHHSEK